ncbi:MAG: glycosyltransferase family 2 protein [Pirellulaceae bacterium]
MSVVIRCRNEAVALRKVFAALQAQQCTFPWEVVVVDNESTDDTAELARSLGAQVVTMAKNEFTYGRALNLGIQHARGELILLLSAHAIPVGAQFLERAAEPFGVPHMAAARCLMIGNPDQIADWYQARDIRYESSDEQRLAESGSAWVGNYPTAGCCVLRRKVWEEVPFDEQLEANEDKQWASQVLARGYTIRCCADAVWLYIRKRNETAERNRRLREHIALYRISGKRPLTWTSYFALVCRVVLAGPWVAVRHVVQHVVWLTCLVTVPWRARRHTTPGAFREYDKHK